jgi:hypothetical protein
MIADEAIVISDEFSAKSVFGMLPKSVRINSERGKIKLSVVVGTDDKDVLGHVWTIVNATERPKVMALNVSLRVPQPQRRSTDLATMAMKLLEHLYDRRVSYDSRSRNLNLSLSSR